MLTLWNNTQQTASVLVSLSSFTGTLWTLYRAAGTPASYSRVSTSNVGPKTGHCHWNSSWFFRVPPGKVNATVDYGPFLPHSSQSLVTGSHVTRVCTPTRVQKLQFVTSKSNRRHQQNCAATTPPGRTYIPSVREVNLLRSHITGKQYFYLRISAL
jgi:hypothetical protein